MNEYMRKLVDQAESGLLDWDKGLEELAADQKNAVQADSFDKLAWELLKDQVPRLDEQTERLTEELGEAMHEAMEDLFNLLHQGDPQFTDRARMEGEYEVNLIVFLDLSETEEFKALLNETRYDEYATAFAMLSMEDQLKVAFEAVKDLREQIANARSQQDQAMQDLANAVDEAMGGGTDPAALEAALQAQADAQAALDAALDAGQAAQQQAVEQLRQGAMQAKNELDAENEALGGWGSEPGELQRMSFEERRALAQRIANSRLEHFAKMLGTFRPFGDAERRRKITHVPEEVYDFELGNDLSRLAATELVNLAVPELEEQWWLRYAQHELMLKKMRGTDRAGQGPIIVVCDESGSMGSVLDHQGNTREAWSKALSLALCDQAKRGKRDFIYIGFASYSQQWEMRFEGGHTPINQVIDFTEHFFNGGTSYEEPLTQAMRIVEEYEQDGKDRPDIVLITDDECMVSGDFTEHWRKVKERAAMTTWGITLGGARYGTMRSLCDRLLAIDVMNAGPDGVKDLFREI